MWEGLPAHGDRLSSGCSQPEAENVPDAEIRRSNSLKLKLNSVYPQPDAENVPDAEIRRSNSLKLKFGLKGRISSSGPNLAFRAAFRLRGRISSSGPNFVFAAEFRLQGRISRFQRSIPEPRTLSNAVFRPNFVFRTKFVFTNEFRLQRAPNRISSSQEFRLHGRFSSSHFVFAHNLSFSSLRTISSSKASEIRLQGGTKPGPTFPGQCINKCQYHDCFYSLQPTNFVCLTAGS